MVPAASLLAVVLSAFAAGRWGLPGAVALACSSLAWLGLNRPMEGRIILVVSDTRGLVAADLIGFAGLALAVVVAVVDLVGRSRASSSASKR